MTCAGAPSTGGSSPRRWGNQYACYSRLHAHRFIPTQVGKSIWAIMINVLATVHPHAGGEIVPLGLKSLLTIGSSPRRWGNLQAIKRVEAQNRFIPTQVGKSSFALMTFLARSVHPHAGGEIVLNCFWRHWPDGSSPRRWGNHAIRHIAASTMRFIPTQVGKSQKRSIPAKTIPVHPHAGGEIGIICSSDE